MIFLGPGYSAQIRVMILGQICHNYHKIQTYEQYLTYWGWNIFMWIQIQSAALFIVMLYDKSKIIFVLN